MNYYIHRISHHAELSYPLLDRGYLSIGFSDFAEEDLIDQTQTGDWQFLDNRFQAYWGTLPRNRSTLKRFLSFQKGDLVLVPSSGTFSICLVTDDRAALIGDSFREDLKTWNGQKVDLIGNHLHDQHGKRFDLGFVRKVKILYRDISREKFADAALTARMKIRQTNSCITSIEPSIEKAIKSYEVNKPIHLHSILIEKTAGLVLDSLTTHLNPNKFERVVSTYFKTIGANQVTIPAKNAPGKEGDADIIAVFENMKLIIYVQAKFQRGQINQWATNQVRDYMSQQDRLDDGYNRIAWVITTADSFHPEAKKIAIENQIQLINGLEFSKLLLNAGMDLFRDFE